MGSEIEIIKKEIIEAYKNVLLTKRREDQVNKILSSKNTIVYADKCARNLIKWNVGNVEDFVKAQFFALDYMPYLPSMMHIASDTALQRFEKVKGYFKYIEGKKQVDKTQKKNSKLLEFDKELYLDFIKLQKFEEDDKRRFHNNISGLLLCMEATSLYHPESKLCRSCGFKVFCRQLLKKKCKPLFDVRHKKINQKIYLKRVSKKEYSIV